MLNPLDGAGTSADELFGTSETGALSSFCDSLGRSGLLIIESQFLSLASVSDTVSISVSPLIEHLSKVESLLSSLPASSSASFSPGHDSSPTF